MLDDQGVISLVTGLLLKETDRDKQKKVGASQISDPCTYHLAKALLGKANTTSKYWLGAKIGTALHKLIEESAREADLEEFPMLKDARIEEKIYLGHLNGYGDIKSTPDLALVHDEQLIDWKTSTREKTRKIKKLLEPPLILNGEPVEVKQDARTAYTIQKYVAQGQLYAKGLNDMGIKISTISLTFINRDGTMESDIYVYTFDYSPELADAVWTRLERLWTDLQNGVDCEELEKNEHCFQCSVAI